jgi:F-box and leucine-rich repeat protein 16
VCEIVAPKATVTQCVRAPIIKGCFFLLCPQVCSLWRDVLYSSPRFWTGLVMVARCRELRAATPESRRRFYNSLHVRGMDTVALTGAATDDDVLELVRHLSAPAARRIHSLSLRCCAVTDRGLESLLAHMQVSKLHNIEIDSSQLKQ